MLRIMKNSSLMMSMLNSAMLNLTLIKQQKFKLASEMTKKPIDILKEFCSIFTD